jgi:hypothetical protein
MSEALLMFNLAIWRFLQTGVFFIIIIIIIKIVIEQGS